MDQCSCSVLSLQNTFLKEKVCDLERQKEENSSEILNFRQTLEKTVSIFKIMVLLGLPSDAVLCTLTSQFSILTDLQQKVDLGNQEHELKLKEKEIALERVGWCVCVAQVVIEQGEG